MNVGKTLSYNVGQQNDPIMKKLSKTDAIALAAADKLERAERRRASRKKISYGRIIASRSKRS